MTKTVKLTNKQTNKIIISHEQIMESVCLHDTFYFTTFHHTDEQNTCYRLRAKTCKNLKITFTDDVGHNYS